MEKKNLSLDWKNDYVSKKKLKTHMVFRSMQIILPEAFKRTAGKLGNRTYTVRRLLYDKPSCKNGSCINTFVTA